jgi:stage III sporulation protein AA
MENILRIIPKDLRSLIRDEIKDVNGLNEIRLRTGFPILIKKSSEEIMLNKSQTEASESSVILSEKQMQECIEYISSYSMYALSEEVGRGFVTITGGHRVGICGRVILGEDGRVRTLRNISSLNIRVAKEIHGACSKITDYIYHQNEYVNTLLVSPPGAGKTTLLRDIVRELSEKGYTIGICDERSEIAAMYQGKIQNRLGFRVDVLDGCPKVIGINMLLRSMAPDIIAVDEIGTLEDAMALRIAAVSGSRMLATAHGLGIEDVKKNPHIKELVEEGYFKRVIVLSKNPEPGTIEGIYGDK